MEKKVDIYFIYITDDWFLKVLIFFSNITTYFINFEKVNIDDE